MGVINLTTHAGVYDDCIGCTDCRMLYSVADMRESMTIVDFIPIVPPVGSVAPWLGSPRGWGRPVATGGKQLAGSNRLRLILIFVSSSLFVSTVLIHRLDYVCISVLI